MQSEQNEKRLIISFPLVYVYAHMRIINDHLKRNVERVIGKDGTLLFRREIERTYVLPAEMELVLPLETYEISRGLLFDDAVFKKYIRESDYSTLDFPIAQTTAKVLMRLAHALGVPKKYRTKKHQHAMVIQTIFDTIAMFGRIDPGVDTTQWNINQWFSYIQENPYAPQRALILTAMNSLRTECTADEMGARLASMVGHMPSEDLLGFALVSIKPDEEKPDGDGDTDTQES